jgi:hypothetical protein
MTAPAADGFTREQAVRSPIVVHFTAAAVGNSCVGVVFQHRERMLVVPD